MSKELPILFNTEMVRAILDGRKTQTRRVVNPQEAVTTHSDGTLVFSWRVTPHVYCPYGRPRDLLYARETWGALQHFDNVKPSEIPDFAEIIYKANGENISVHKWRPSIHMPKKFARIWLRVTDVRVEKIVDISPNDIYAEGAGCGESSGELIKMFRELWDSINAKRGYGWETNPWVWVVEFEKERTV